MNVVGVIARKAEWDLTRGYHQGQRYMNDCISRPDKTHLTHRQKPQITPCTAGAIDRRHSCSSLEFPLVAQVARFPPQFSNGLVWS